MATKKDIITLPHPSLREQSEEITDFGSSVKKLTEEMLSATLDWEQSKKHEAAIGLAAVQINHLARVVIIREDIDDRNSNFDVFINPEITRFDGDLEYDYEGCLSVSHIYAMVPRYPKIKVRAKNLEGKSVKFVLKGYKARLFQHEIDHTNGITIVDRAGADSKFMTLSDDGSWKPIDGKNKENLVTDLGIPHEPKN